MKYEIYELNGLEFPVIHPNMAPHFNADFNHARIVAAGECSFQATHEDGDCNVYHNDAIEVSCWGESISLGVKSRGQRDENLIKRMLEKH